MPRKFRSEGDKKPSTPYQRAAQEWDDRIGSARIQAKNWRLAAILILILVAFPAIGGLVYVSAQPKQVHIVEVSTDGNASYRGPGGRSYSGYKASEASIKYHLDRFVKNTRSISSDQAVLKQHWLDAYKLITPKAKNLLDKYIQDNDPFVRAANERIGVTVTSMLPLSDDSWQIDWVESKWDAKGLAVGDTRWRGVFKVLINQPRTTAQLAANPIGLYIDEFHWTKTVQQ